MLETAVAKPSNPPARHPSRGRRRALGGRRAKARWLRRSALADASGFTLAEVLVALVLMSVVLTAILGLLEQSSRVANSDVERDASLNEQTSAFFRMIDELRQAYQVNCPS